MLTVVRVWILFSAVLVGSGWILSACHQLNPIGYKIVFALMALAWIFFKKNKQFVTGKELIRAARKFLRRFKRFMPLGFLALAMMSLAGGLLYVSMDGDGLAYRIPRVLHWLWQEQWHWIRTTDCRMNIAGCGFEWLYAPLILFTKTDRFLFLLNWISYLMLPGLVFSVFIRLGVSRRVAWWWMWLLPSGWCYALQAGSFHNDSLPVIYALASVDLALRARERQNLSDLWLSLLAAALITGVKQTDIPLALVWLIAAWPCRQLFLANPLGSLAVGVFGLLVSAVPMIIINLKHVGTWTGIPPINNFELHSPIWGIVGNSFCLPIQNLLPPFFPWANNWNQAMEHFLATPFGAHFTSFEAFGHLRRSISDSNAGIGLGICLLLIISLVAQGWRSRPTPIGTVSLTGHPNVHLRLLRLTPWLLLLLFMAKVGTWANARHLGPYYVFFFPVFLVLPVQAKLLRRGWWRQLAFLVMLITATLLFLSQHRPLFPAQTLLAGLQTKYPNSRLILALQNSYGFRSSFENLRNIFLKTLPPGETIIGYATSGDSAEPGLALPFGRLKVERILPDDSPDQLRLAGIRYIAFEDRWLIWRKESLEQWIKRFDCDLIDQVTFCYDPYIPPGHLYLVCLRPHPVQ